MFMWLFLCQDALMFFGLFAAYLSVRIGAGNFWPLPGADHPAAGIEPNPLSINLTALNTFMLICSSVTMVQALKAMKDGKRDVMTKWLIATVIGGSIFMGIQFSEYNKLIHVEHLRMPHSLFDATFFMLTGFHGMHVLAGVVYLSTLATASNFYEKRGMTIDMWIMLVVAIAGAFGLRQAIHSFFSLPYFTTGIVGACYGTALFGMYAGFKWILRNNPTHEVIEVAGLYWHFVDLVWIILFTLVYLI